MVLVVAAAAAAAVVEVVALEVDQDMVVDLVLVEA